MAVGNGLRPRGVTCRDQARSSGRAGAAGPDARKRFEDAVSDVRQLYVDSDDEYLAMTNQVIKAYFERIFGGSP
jgi:hypothetical protein